MNTQKKSTNFSKYDFDFIIIGAGSAGIAAANMAASFNKKVLLLEQSKTGGTCVNVGCVPKKFMWLGLDIFKESTMLLETPISQGKLTFSLSALNQYRDQYIKNINKSYEQTFSNNNIQFIQGHALFTSPHSVQINGQCYTGNHLFFCTGSKPILPNLPGSQLAYTSNDFFRLNQIPQTVTISGSGYIAVELANLVAEIQESCQQKVDVTLIVRSTQLIKSVDSSLTQNLASNLQSIGIKILFNEQVKQIKKTHPNSPTSNVQLDLLNQSLNSNFHIWAIGREANLDFLTQESSKLLTRTDKGNIHYDERLQTSLPNHYIMGDLLENKPQLTPYAIMCARRLVSDLCKENSSVLHPFKHTDIQLVPTVVFSNPPIATIGKTEQQLKQEKINYMVYETEFNPMRYKLSSKQQLKTYIKLICEERTQKVLGIHMIGLHCDEILQGFSVAMNMGATKKDFDTTLAIHPISAEELVTLKPLSLG